MSAQPARLRPVVSVLSPREIERLIFLKWLIAKGYVSEVR